MQKRLLLTVCPPAPVKYTGGSLLISASSLSFTSYLKHNDQTDIITID
jgi:hypothetical protein